MHWGGTDCTPNPNGPGPRTPKNPDAVTQLQTALPPILTEPRADHRGVGPGKVLAQDATRLGLLPVVRRRLPAYGVPPGAAVTSQFDPFYLYGAVAPTTGARVFLALPSLHSRACQGGWDGCAAAFPESVHMLGLDNGAGHKATAVRWPSKVVPVCLPPSSPELTPLARLWRALKEQLAAVPAKTIAALSDAMCAIIQRYSPAALHSLTSFTYCVQAVETVQKALYG
jgi:hypothetical protein